MTASGGVVILIGNKRRGKEDAVFIGWQKTGTGKQIPLYNITAPAHPLKGSTVSDKTLYRLNLRIPPTPMFRENVERLEPAGGIHWEEFSRSLSRLNPFQVHGK